MKARELRVTRAVSSDAYRVLIGSMPSLHSIVCKLSQGNVDFNEIAVGLQQTGRGVRYIHLDSEDVWGSVCGASMTRVFDVIAGRAQKLEKIVLKGVTVHGNSALEVMKTCRRIATVKEIT